MMHEIDFRKASLARTEQLDRCKKLHKEGAALEASGQKQAAADKYLESIMAARHMWHQVRYVSFLKYIGIFESFQMFGKTLTPAAFKTVESIAKDQEELKIFRAKACLVLACNASKECLYHLSANYYRSIIDLVEESRKSRQTFHNGAFIERDIILYVFGDDGVTEIPTKLGDAIDELGEDIKCTLHSLESLDSLFLRNVSKTVFQTDDDSILDRLRAGGGKCDFCGKKAEMMEGGELMQCARCQRAYYCSGSCQKKQWKAGHKKACRAPAQIEIGDLMLVKGIVREPDLNKRIVKIIKPAETKGRWEVVVHGSNNVISLASKNLYHIRPAK